ncbi:MAG TPA: aminotransferase class I/II-fold pyridoxal phosphate-dependent enzyme [Candidatus Limnocylindrales bacterium]|nr:aminotransferase class I/II-fold pyridoxal phosphate-dependent enzyme [Candidatus Limnocylindrales bacterium]
MTRDEARAKGFATRAIRAAARSPEVGQRPTAVPIYQTATFASADAAELGDVLTDRQPGYAYSRIDNPTTAALAAAVAELEGAEAGYAFASGMAAIHAALVSLLEAGDRVVCTRAVYGSTRSQLASVLRRLGVTTEFVDVTDHAAMEASLAAAPTRVLYAETISNPTIVVADHHALAGLARRHGAAYVVDNTFASPYLCRPIELGADLVVESATKYLGGHSDVLAGIVVGGREAIRRVRDVQVDTGGTLAPLSAFLVLRGIATLALRMERHAATAAALAAWLERQEGVLRVYHPSLTSHPQHEVAARQLAAGGGMLAFEVAGGRAGGRALIDGLSITELTASLGSVHTMVVHPPSTTHRQLDEAALAEAGIAPGLLRVSVGLEDLDDLVADFERALGAARDAVAADRVVTSGEQPTATAVRRA